MRVVQQALPLKFLLVFLSVVFTQALVAGELQVSFTDKDGNLLEDVVIEIINLDIPVPSTWDYTGIMDQVDKEFVNNVITIVAGSDVTFPNSDDLHHHVYSFSDNLTFELPLYIGNSAAPIKFNDAGVTVVGCNIHDWMLGYIYVGESHLMAKTRNDGLAKIANLNAGEYSFSVWHPRIRRRDSNEVHTIEISAEGITNHAIELNLGRDQRIRRAPSAGGSDY